MQYKRQIRCHLILFRAHSHRVHWHPVHSHHSLVSLQLWVATVASLKSPRNLKSRSAHAGVNPIAEHNANCAHRHRTRPPQSRAIAYSKRRHDCPWHPVTFDPSQDSSTVHSIFYHNPSTTFDHSLHLHGIYHVGRGRTKTHRNTRHPSEPSAHTRGTSLRLPIQPPSFILVKILEWHEEAQHA
jgi:hypothetical protein